MTLAPDAGADLLRARVLPFGSPPVQWQFWYDTATQTGPEIFLYSRDLSITAGAPLELCVHTTLAEYELEIWRDGASPVRVYDQVHRGQAQQTNDRPYRNGCGWNVTDTVPTEDWPAGGYVISARGTADGREVRHTHWFAIRPQTLDPTHLTLVASTMTWQAYNSWGGSNHYEGIDGQDEDQYSPVLSYDRPQQAGTAWLPVGAPRISAPTPEPGSHVHYPVLDWALAHNYPKYFAAAGWAAYERHLLVWAENHGYTVDVITQHDLHFRPELLQHAGPVIFAGHDEYWTRPMRENLDDFVGAGGQVGRLGGNFIWQVRLSEDGATQTCYKYRAPDEDPVRLDPDRQHELTFAWDKAVVDYPAAKTFGASGTRGCYVSLGALAPAASGGFTVYRPEHWVLAGTGAHYGDVIGSKSRAVSFEVDGLDYTFRHGLPYATDDNGIDPDTVEIIALCPADNLEVDHGIAGSDLFVGDADIGMFALTYYDEDTPEAREATRRGCGVLVELRSGEGRVITAGSAEWVNGLRLGDREVEQITANILDGLLAGSAVGAARNTG